MNKHDIIQEILNLTFKHNRLAVHAHDLENMKWHNEFKKENHKDEFEKWRNKIKVIYGILSAYDEKTDLWIFEHKDRSDYLEILKQNKE